MYEGCDVVWVGNCVVMCGVGECGKCGEFVMLVVVYCVGECIVIVGEELEWLCVVVFFVYE